MKRGELYRLRGAPGDPKTERVVVVLSRSALISSRFSTVVCAAVYSRGEGLATQVPIGVDEGMKHRSWIMCDHLFSNAKRELTNYVGSLPIEKLAEVNQALRTALDL